MTDSTQLAAVVPNKKPAQVITCAVLSFFPAAYLMVFFLDILTPYIRPMNIVEKYPFLVCFFLTLPGFLHILVPVLLMCIPWIFLFFPGKIQLKSKRVIIFFTIIQSILSARFIHGDGMIYLYEAQDGFKAHLLHLYNWLSNETMLVWMSICPMKLNRIIFFKLFFHICGIITALFMYSLSRNLFKKDSQRGVFLFFSLCSYPVLQMFCGYFETYGLIICIMSFFFWAALKISLHPVRVMLLFTAVLLMPLYHVALSVFLLPLAVFLFFKQKKLLLLFLPVICIWCGFSVYEIFSPVSFFFQFSEFTMFKNPALSERILVLMNILYTGIFPAMIFFIFRISTGCIQMFWDLSALCGAFVIIGTFPPMGIGSDFDAYTPFIFAIMTAAGYRAAQILSFVVNTAICQTAILTAAFIYVHSFFTAGYIPPGASCDLYNTTEIYRNQVFYGKKILKEPWHERYENYLFYMLQNGPDNMRHTAQENFKYFIPRKKIMQNLPESVKIHYWKQPVNLKKTILD